MDVKTFPFRLDNHTQSLISNLVNQLSTHEARIQSLVQGQCSLLFDKGLGIPDANMIFAPDGITLQYNLKTIAKHSRDSASWLNNFHSFLEKQKKSSLSPVGPRCSVNVRASYDGTIQYFLTYLVRYPDESIAQETPQGTLFASGGLFGKPIKHSEEKEKQGVWS